MKHPVALITGIAGFAGSFLAEDLLSHGWKVHGTTLPGESKEKISHLKKDLHLSQVDITNSKRLATVVKKVCPDFIFHLAAQASVGDSFQHEQQTFEVNFGGSVNILRAAAELKRLRKIVMVSSADVYGQFDPVGKTLTEKQPFRPLSPYGVAKAAAEHACHYYHKAYGLPVVVARPFNHAGPRQSDRFALPSFARQIAEIEKGRARPILKVGDLSARRDLSDVRDIVAGYRLAALKGKPGEAYQFCSGKSPSIGQVLDMLLKMSKVKITVKVDRARLRSADIPVLKGSHRKATRELGYVPGYTLKETLADTLDYWRQKVT